MGQDVMMHDGHVSRLLKLGREKGMTPDRWTDLLASPAFAALLDPRADLSNVEAVRAALKLPARRGKKAGFETPIHVDRKARPVYPDWVDQDSINTEEFLKLERSGLSDYDLAKIVQWLHDGQKNGGRATGNRIHEHLKTSNLLEVCLGLADLQAIQKLPVETFRKYFKGKAVFGWKSVVRRRYGYLLVPYLVEDGGQVKLHWFWLGYDFRERHPALRFAS